MTVAWLELRDFRCHEALMLQPDSGVNILIGPNGAGKTSILEAIAYGASLRSFRGTPDTSLVRSGATEAILRTGVATPGGERTIEVALPAEGRRRVLVNGKRPRTNADLAETLSVVAFLPDDLEFVKGGPGRRRSFLDDLAGQLSPQAGDAHSEYARALRQRNTLLKQEGRRADPVTLGVWDERVAAAGGRVTRHRLALMDELAPVLVEAHRSVSGSAQIRMTYASSWLDDASVRDEADLSARLLAALGQRRSRDMEIRVTTTGPHRDEPVLWLAARPARTEASQGEQRTVALALRLASYRLIEVRRGRPPVLLLDDVFSELDVSRAGGVMAVLPRGQVFVTSAREDEVPLSGRMWRVSEGSVT